MNRLVVSFLFIVAFLLSPSCSHSETEELLVTKEVDYKELEKNLNLNIQSIRHLIENKKNNKPLFSVRSSEEETLLFFLEEEKPVALKKIISSIPILYPCFSIAPFVDDYYWTLSGEFITDSKGNKLCVKDTEIIPSLQYKNDQWNCVVGDSSFVLDNTRLSYGYPTVERMDEGSVYVSFPYHFQFSIPLSDLQLPKVPNKAFYKEIFIDAGVGLNSRKNLSAAGYLKLPLEAMDFPRNDATAEHKRLQNEIIAGNAEDTNGRLLYPDGQPRYKILFVNGGSSTTHGRSLDEKARENMRLFVHNGGSYVGCCAGAFFASNGYDDKADYPYYLSLLPIVMNHTGLERSSTGMFVEQKSPLLNYYNFGDDLYVENVYHSRGGYPVSVPEGVEVLARFDRPDKDHVHMKPCIMAYKTSEMSGRIVTTGSHPEYASDGEIRDLTASMFLYAIDGLGYTTLKGFLQNGKPRQMDKSTEDRQPSYTKIGDKQYHHFVVYIPDKAKNIKVSVNSNKDCDLALRMDKDTFAYADDAVFTSKKGGSSQVLYVDTLEEGLWFISVQCLTTPTVEKTDFGQTYTGRTDVLNGIPYSIEVSWE